MKFFIDSGQITEIEKAVQTGLIDGVTTNPSLVAKSGLKHEDLLLRICEIIDGPISAEVISTECEEMIAEGVKLSSLHKNIVVKLPLTTDGLKACASLTQKKIKTNVTLCFSVMQALCAAKAGATYISPFVGRLEDIGQRGMELIDEIKLIYDNYGFKTQILVASIRTVDHVIQSAQIGAHVATLPYSVFSKFLDHPLTKSGLEAFLKDHEASLKK